LSHCAVTLFESTFVSFLYWRFTFFVAYSQGGMGRDRDKETIMEWYKQTQLLVSADDGTSSRSDTTAASAAGSETLLAIPMDDLAAV
jgi:hypothetical protein